MTADELDRTAIRARHVPDPDDGECRGCYENCSHCEGTKPWPCETLALLDALDAAEGEVARLRAWKAEALPVMAGLQEVGRALDVPLGRQITARATVDAALDLRNQRDSERARAEAEREAKHQAVEHWQSVVESMRTDRDSEGSRADRLVAAVQAFIDADADHIVQAASHLLALVGGTQDAVECTCGLPELEFPAQHATSCPRFTAGRAGARATAEAGDGE